MVLVESGLVIFGWIKLVILCRLLILHRFRSRWPFGLSLIYSGRQLRFLRTLCTQIHLWFLFVVYFVLILLWNLQRGSSIQCCWIFIHEIYLIHLWFLFVVYFVLILLWNLQRGSSIQCSWIFIHEIYLFIPSFIKLAILCRLLILHRFRSRWPFGLSLIYSGRQLRFLRTLCTQIHLWLLFVVYFVLILLWNLQRGSSIQCSWIFIHEIYLIHLWFLFVIYFVLILLWNLQRGSSIQCSWIFIHEIYLFIPFFNKLAILCRLLILHRFRSRWPFGLSLIYSGRQLRFLRTLCTQIHLWLLFVVYFVLILLWNLQRGSSIQCSWIFIHEIYLIHLWFLFVIYFVLILLWNLQRGSSIQCSWIFIHEIYLIHLWFLFVVYFVLILLWNLQRGSSIQCSWIFIHEMYLFIPSFNKLAILCRLLILHRFRSK